MNFDFDTLFIPVASSLVGLVPMLISLFVSAMEKRSQTARLDSVLKQVNNRVEFLTAWYGLQKEVADPTHLSQIKSSVNEELEDVYELFIDVVLDPDKDTKQRKDAIANYRKTNAVRRFFLLYSPYNIRGWLFHTLYYMAGIPVLAAIGYMVYSQIQYKDFMYNIPQQNLIFAGIAVLLVIVFRGLGRGAAKDIEERMVKVDQKTMPLRSRKPLGPKE